MIVEAKGYITNYERFYTIPKFNNLRGVPMIPRLEDG
jgi:hypothetical protein